MEELLAKWKRKLRPHPGVRRKGEAMAAAVQKRLKAAGLSADCVLGGSVAKGTHLRDAADVDLFVRFSPTYESGALSNLLEPALAPFRPERLHGSRDYFSFERGGLTFEAVPVLRIAKAEEAKNVTDASLLHVAWTTARLRIRPELADEIRLAKQFCKAARLYGAESYIAGFSGHILDILAFAHGSFLRLLEQAARWESRAIIDIEGHHVDPLAALNVAKIVSPLIVVDPIQPDRNAAAAVSKEKYLLFKEKAAAFLARPSDEFFVLKPIREAELRARFSQSMLLLVRVQTLPQKRDVAGSKILKVFSHLRDELARHEFLVLDAGWQLEPKPLLYFALTRETLPATMLRVGPPIGAARHAAAFRDKHNRARVEKGRLVASIRRTYRTPDLLVRDLLNAPYVKERVKKASLRTR